MPEVPTHEAPAPLSATSRPRHFTLRQRISLRLIIWAGYWLIRLIGPTLRIAVSLEDGAPEGPGVRPVVASFWHNCIIPATWVCRNYRIHVMNSTSYDGEYIARIIRRFGFVPVRGSSSRHAVRALLGLRRALDDGWTVAFTIDGPRGPRYKVKPGPVALARSSGVPLAMFHLAVDKAWILNSWDRLMIPKPFSRVLMRIGKLIHVPLDATDEDLQRHTAELQSSLDRVRDFAESSVHKAGTPEFPYYKREA
ncbi:MAG: lysophospholipid acyltransferase family protein [Acidobacteriia bacterium]|nr:lysophospholipid acyltransferase family protein [Terriglobia bacterium]